MGKLANVATFRAVHPALIQGQVRTSGYTWDGVIVVRAYTGDLFDEQDYRELLWGGKAGLQRGERAGGQMAQTLITQAQRRLDSLCVDRVDFHNIACNAGRTQILNYIGNLASATTGANVFAVGTGNLSSSPVKTSDTQLVNEVFRLGTSNSSVSGNQVQINTFFSTSQANYTYTEAGLFLVASPPGSANTGTLFAHAPYSYAKTSSVSLTNDYFISLN